MRAIKSCLKKSFQLVIIAMLFMSCSAYRFHQLNINGNSEHLFRTGECKLSMKANQVETLGKVNLQFQVLEGMVVHVNSLKLTIDDELIPQEQINIRYAGKKQQFDFDVIKNGTLTLTLEKLIIAGRTRIAIIPSAFIRCKGNNMVNEHLQIQLKNLE